MCQSEGEEVIELRKEKLLSAIEKFLQAGIAVLFAVMIIINFTSSENAMVLNVEEKVTLSDIPGLAPRSSHESARNTTAEQAATALDEANEDIPASEVPQTNSVSQQNEESLLEASQNPVASERSGLININTATKEELMTLNGIGEVKAQAIIDYRTQYGDFISLEELTDVSGIGEKTLEKIRDQITI